MNDPKLTAATENNIRVIKHKQTLFNEGDCADCAYVIESGELDIFTGSGFDEVMLCRLGSGDIVGEMGVIDGSPRTATAKAVGDVRLVVISRGQLTERISTADPVLKLLVKILLDRYRAGLVSVQENSGLEHSVSDVLLDDAESDHAQRGIDKIRLEAELKQALLQRQLNVGYQPILGVNHQRVAGFEALVRWSHPTRGAISPAMFIGLAEETSLIVPVGLYVFEQACRDMKRFIRDLSEPHHPFMSINVSLKQISDCAFLPQAAALVDKYGLKRSAIKLEITESMAFDLSLIRNWVKRAHEYGFMVSLDDFGTGYSALSALDILMVDVVKLDRSFIRRIENQRARDLLSSTIELVKSMDSQVVVEGVETEQQLEFITDLGCEFAQGFLIGQSLAFEDANAMLKTVFRVRDKLNQPSQT